MGCGAAEPQLLPADLVLRGGVVITVDPDIGDQQAVAISGHRIVAVGTDTTIARYIGSETEVIEQ